MIKNFLLAGIRFYQKHLSLGNPLVKSLFLTDQACRFVPTCSEYSYQAIEKYGTIRGLWLGLGRIVRCHPFNKGGLDPIP